MKYYFCKYVPPRSDFLTTLSVEEKELMAQHGAYLNQLLDQGFVVAHGPVIDATGGFGLSLFQIGDEETIATYTSEDPLVLKGVGHYEHFGMLNLKTKL